MSSNITQENFSIIIPCYNERDNIEGLVKEIKLSLKEYINYEIIIIDDGSTDNLSEIYASLKNNNKFLKIIYHNKNLGQSKSILSGIHSSKYNVIVTIDGDGQNNPSDIPKLLNLFFQNKEVSLVGGIRLKRKDSLIKRYSSLIANKFRSKILKDNCVDTGCSLKVFEKDIFLQFPFFDGIHRFLPALFIGFGRKTLYQNVDHRHRLKGLSKYGTFDRLLKGIRDLIKVKKLLNNLKND